eukprot:1387742-Amorphochlora_amoeboformis.AAC.1
MPQHLSAMLPFCYFVLDWFWGRENGGIKGVWEHRNTKRGSEFLCEENGLIFSEGEKGHSSGGDILLHWGGWYEWWSFGTYVGCRCIV